ncbi:MAG TPA: hypothetical protein VFE42_18430 [Chloroflexota bacterium]|nr:hypothetical protein [Chloroflexota bacterium]
MSSLSTRLLGGELLTIPQFCHEIIAHLSYQSPDLRVDQPRPGILSVARASGPAHQFNLQSSYRLYQRNPRARDDLIRRLVRWIDTTVNGGPTAGT